VVDAAVAPAWACMPLKPSDITTKARIVLVRISASKHIGNPAHIHAER
jgi:hypothetical protein